MASSSSLDSSSALKKYDVFVSFRGEDSRTTFVSYLLRAFDRKGIVTFKDVVTEEYVSISDVLRFSRIALVVLSENYASSRWCLDELQTIMELQKEEEDGLKVVPIFYGVDPSDVGSQTGRFGDGFVGLKRRETAEEVQKWREALTRVSDFSGMDSSQWKTDAVMIEYLVELVSAVLLPPVATNLITLFRMDRHTKAIHGLLGSEPDNQVHIVGIYGMGGVGKTTLARRVYDEISDDFSVRGFLENLRKIDQTHGLSYSLEKFLCGDSRREVPRMGSDNVDSDVMKPRLRNRKVLLVVDDVQKPEELRDVVDEADEFGPGSRVIVTTRDKGLLAACGVTRFYEVECLRYDEALQLFCQVAFKQEYPPSSFEQLSVHAIQLAGCLPLALKLLGSLLCGKGAKEWRSVLRRLEEAQDKGSKDITEVLRLRQSRADDSFILPSK